MPSYRLYCFDGRGRLWVDEGLRAASDEEAINAAHEMATATKCELWEGHRLVATIQPQRRKSVG
jgi:hypothetical protein